MQRAVVGAAKGDQVFGRMPAAIGLATDVVHVHEDRLTRLHHLTPMV
jgi:hypothetical protein